MEVLVVYDISTETPAGERRLRSVAKLCEGYGQRVQKSVFECTIAAPDLRRLVHALETVIDVRVDRVGIYRLREPYKGYVTNLGLSSDIDWRGPVVL